MHWGISDIDSQIGARKVWRPGGALPAHVRPITAVDKAEREITARRHDSGCRYFPTCIHCALPTGWPLCPANQPEKPARKVKVGGAR